MLAGTPGTWAFVCKGSASWGHPAWSAINRADVVPWTPDRDAGLYRYRGGAKFDGLLQGVAAITQGFTSPTGEDGQTHCELRLIGDTRATAA